MRAVKYPCETRRISHISVCGMSMGSIFAYAIIALMSDGQSTPPHAIAPIREDFRNAPPTYMYYGEEVLAGNAAAYRRAFARDGVGDRLHVEIVKNMMHGYSCMPVFPESKKAYFETIGLIQEL